MNLQQLEYIVALDKYKNFSKAAESCFITQATLSTMVKKLEEELEVVLFDRKTNPILTTDCGRELIKEAQEILYHSKKLKEYSSQLKGKIEGELRIGIIPTIAGNLLHRVLPTLLLKYPFLKSHPQYEIAKKQMKAGGNIVAFEIEGGLEAGRAFLDRIKLCSLSPNLGDTRTTATHPASTTHAKLKEEERVAVGIQPGLIRISVGLEHIEDIKAEIEGALSKSK
jgi:DNA-binding transcriptional LysR family regulator